MKIEKVAIGALQQDPNNKRLRTDENYAALLESLRRFGQQIPIVVRKDRTIIKGNGTWLAGKELGWKDIWVHWSGLKDGEADLYAIADNRIAELSEWDYEQLSIAMQSNEGLAAELTTLGWTEQLLAPLRIAVWKADEIEKLEVPATPPHLEPVLFYDFTDADMIVVAGAVARWRDKHPGSTKLSNQECLTALCAWYTNRPKAEL